MDFDIKKSFPSQPVSVIICAKNEARNLSRNLPEILNQDYTDKDGNTLYEVIVADDDSEDNSFEVLQNLSQNYPHLRPVKFSKSEERKWPGKKSALHFAKQQASHNFLLLTDADTCPRSSFWIKNMMASLNNRDNPAPVVLGYGPYKKQNSFLNVFIRWETIHTFLQFASAALDGHPYMGVGRNMLHRRALIEKPVSANYANCSSGDDDLWLQNVAPNQKLEVVASPEAHMLSHAPPTFQKWIFQKQRHNSTGKYYLTSIKINLGLYALTHALSWLAWVFIWLTSSSFFYVILGLLLVRHVLFGVLVKKWSLHLRENFSGLQILLCDIMWMVYNLLLSPYIFFKNKNQWN